MVICGSVFRGHTWQYSVDHKWCQDLFLGLSHSCILGKHLTLCATSLAQEDFTYLTQVFLELLHRLTKSVVWKKVNSLSW